MRPVLVGAAAGLAATAAMTAAMLAMFRLLPRIQRYPLPPAEITAEIKHQTGLGHLATSNQTLLAHFAYGSAGGALFPLLARQQGNVATGVLYGLAVWAASYLGWLPAFEILKPATRHPRARNGLMLLAHAAWGAVLALSQRVLLNQGKHHAVDQ